MSDETAPRIKFPESSGEYKVVQLDVDAQPHLLFGPERLIHGYILESFLFDDGRDYPTTIGMESKKKVPAPRSDWYRVRGMGRATVDVVQKRARFFGSSVDYGSAISGMHLDSMKPFAPDWTFEKGGLYG